MTFAKKRYLQGAIAALSAHSVVAFAGPCPAPAGTELVVSSAIDQACLPGDGINTTITSTGSIIQTTGPAVDGIEVDAGIAAGTITVGGVISTGDRSIFVGGSAAGVQNSGTINTIYVTGTIQSLQNSGNITGAADNGIWVNGGTVGSGVVNTATGVISGAVVGLDAENSAHIGGNILNQGQINTTSLGIHIDTAAQVNGSIVNDTGATLSAPLAIVIENNAHISGDVVNRGTITASYTGIASYLASIAGNIDNSGTIHSTTAPAITISNSPLIGGVINQSSGSISSANDTALKIQTSTLTHGLNNAGSIQGGDSGIGFGTSIIQSGGFINSGTITSTNYAGIDMWSSTVTGDILNSGTVSSPNFGVQIRDVTTLQGSLLNQGVIAGGLYGLLLSGITVSGDVRNDGTIQATSTSTANSAVRISSDSGTTTIQGAFINGSAGKISATGNAVTLTNVSINGGVQNAGTISSSGAAGIAVNTVTTAGSAGVSNSGTISGTTGGLQIAHSTVAGNIDNSGTIQASAANGTALQLTSTSVGGTLNNSGVLQGTTALDLSSTPALTVNNSGQLNGAVLLGDSTLNLSGTTAQLNGAVSGSSNSAINILGSIDSAATLNVGSITIGSQARYVARGAIQVAQALTNSGELVVHTSSPLAVAGNYVQTAGATYSVVAEGSSAAATVPALTVSGTATLAPGTNIHVDVSAATLAAKKTLRLISAGTLISNGLTITDNSFLLNFVPELSDGTLNLIAVKAASVSDGVLATSDRRALPLARVLDQTFNAAANSAAGGNAVAPGVQSLQSAFENLNDANAVTHAADQLLPLYNGSGAAIMLDTVRRTAQSIDLRNQQTPDQRAGDVNVWLTPFREYSRVSADQDNGGHGYRLYNNGFQLGGLAPLAGLHAEAGGSFSYYHIDYRNGDNNAPQAATTDQIYVAATGRARTAAGLGIDGQIGGGVQHTYGQRTATFTGSPQIAQGAFDGVNLHAGTGMSYLWQSGSLHVIPRVALDYDAVRNAGYSENGTGPATLQVAAQTAQTAAANLGVTLEYSPRPGWNASFYGGGGYDLFANYPAQRASLVNGLIPFQVQGDDPGRWTVRTGAAMTIHLASNGLLELRYDLDMRHNALSQLVALAFKKYF